MGKGRSAVLVSVVRTNCFVKSFPQRSQRQMIGDGHCLLSSRFYTKERLFTHAYGEKQQSLRVIFPLRGGL